MREGTYSGHQLISYSMSVYPRKDLLGFRHTGSAPYTCVIPLSVSSSAPTSGSAPLDFTSTILLAQNILDASNLKHILYQISR